MILNPTTVKTMQNTTLRLYSEAALNVLTIKEARLNTPISDMDAAPKIFDLCAGELVERAKDALAPRDYANPKGGR